MTDVRAGHFDVVEQDGAVLIVTSTAPHPASDAAPPQQLQWRLATLTEARTFVDELLAAADDSGDPVPCGTVRYGPPRWRQGAISSRVALLPPKTDGDPAVARLVVTAHTNDDTAVDVWDLDMTELGTLINAVRRACHTAWGRQ